MTSNGGGMAAGVTVRSMRVMDLEEVVQIEREVYARPWTVERFRKEVVRKRIAALVAMVNGKVVGFVLYNYRESYLVITSIGVAKEYRRQGVGRRLITPIMSRMFGPSSYPESQLIREIQVDATHLSADGWAFFNAMGFIARSERRMVCKPLRKEVGNVE